MFCMTNAQGSHALRIFQLVSVFGVKGVQGADQIRPANQSPQGRQLGLFTSLREESAHPLHHRRISDHAAISKEQFHHEVPFQLATLQQLTGCNVNLVKISTMQAVPDDAEDLVFESEIVS